MFRSTAPGAQPLRCARYLLLPVLLCPAMAFAHGVSARDAGFVAGIEGVHFWPFVYLGAKHMVTGYDHLLYLAGVVFLLHRLRDVVIYATLFALGHSLTLLGAVLAGWHANAWLVDAVIGLSVVYKGFENIGGFRNVGWRLDPRAAVFGFGLVHGLGLATKLQDLHLSPDGLFVNLVAFNIGVEVGQVLALAVMVLVFALWRRSPGFPRAVYPANVALMCAGFVLFGLQLSGWALGLAPVALAMRFP